MKRKSLILLFALVLVLNLGSISNAQMRKDKIKEKISLLESQQMECIRLYYNFTNKYKAKFGKSPQKDGYVNMKNKSLKAQKKYRTKQYSLYKSRKNIASKNYKTYKIYKSKYKKFKSKKHKRLKTKWWKKFKSSRISREKAYIFYELADSTYMIHHHNIELNKLKHYLKTPKCENNCCF